MQPNGDVKRVKYQDDYGNRQLGYFERHYHRNHYNQHHQHHQHQQHQQQMYSNQQQQPSPTSSGTTTTPTNSHSQALYKTETIGDEKEKGWGPCFWIFSVLFFIMIIMLVVCLIVFFTVGKGGSAESEITIDGSEPIPLFAQSSAAAISARRSESHNDFVSPEFVLTAMTRGKPKICLFDTAYLHENYVRLYNQEHIPGANHFDIDTVTNRTRGKWRSLIHPQKMQQYARLLGVDNDCHVVLYDHGEKRISLKSATYAWWLFKVFGHKTVSIMNGGLKFWKAKNFETTKAVSFRPPEGNFLAKWEPYWIITFEDIMQNFQKPKYVIVDSRKPSDFYGDSKHPLAAGGGRIKGAINVPTDILVNRDGSLKQVPELRKIFANYGIRRERPVIVYCNTGLQASVLYFSMVQCDFDAKLYDGGWVEWSFKAPEQYKEIN